MKMIAHLIGWFVFLALTKNFSHAQDVKFEIDQQQQTAFVGSCAEIKCRVTTELDIEGAYWFWMKNAVYNKSKKDYEGTIIYSTNKSERPVNPDFEEGVKYIRSETSRWNGASSKPTQTLFSILICNLTKNDNGNYSVRFVKKKLIWKTEPEVNLTVIDNPCPITFVQEPSSIVKESDTIKLKCSTLSSCTSDLQMEDLTQSPSKLETTGQEKSIFFNFTARWQDDGKIYSCQTQYNKDPYVIQNITLNVEYAPKETVAIMHPGNIKEGDHVTLMCSAKGRPESSFTWFKNDPDNQEIVSREAQWQITSIEGSQSGEYHCVAKNKHGNSTSNVLTIDVQYAPEVEVEMTPNASKVKEGDTITLTCNVKRSNPAPHWYVWHKDHGDTVCHTHQYVKAIHPEDRGSYTCTATNTVGSATSKPHEIIVEYMPRKSSISTSTSGNIVKAGGSITFTCATDANPPPSRYSWYRYNENKQAIPQWNPSTATNQHSLYNVQRTDEAWYMCNATNSIGTGENSNWLYLKVRYAPTNVVLTMDTEVKEGQLIKITCTVESFPCSKLMLLTTSTLDLKPSTLQFPKDGKDMKDNLLRYTFVVTSAHMGFYTCSASNEEGSGTSTPRKLLVKHGPKDVKVQVTPGVVVNENTFLTLHCKANSYPTATSFTWMKMTDGKNEKMQNAQQTIQIQSVNASDRGRYSCEARNEMGTGLSEGVDVRVKYAPKHTYIIKDPEQQDSDGARFVMLTCHSQSEPPIGEYAWYRKDEKTDNKVSQSRTFKVYSNNPGVYYCIAKNEINQKKSDPVNLFDRSYLPVLKFVFLALIILLIVFSLFLVYRHKRNKAIQQRTTNTSPSFDFLVMSHSCNRFCVSLWDKSQESKITYLCVFVCKSIQGWWNGASLRNLRNDPITAEPFRSRDDLLPDQPCRPNAQRRQPQPDSTPASNVNTVYSTVNLPAGNMGPSAQKPVRRQGGNTGDDSLNYASINFGNKQKKKQTKADVNDVYAVVSKPKPAKKNGQEKLEDYENINAVHPAKSPDPFNYDTDTSEDEVELNYTRVSFKAKPGYQRSKSDSSTSDEEETQYSDVKI